MSHKFEVIDLRRFHRVDVRENAMQSHYNSTIISLKNHNSRIHIYKHNVVFTTKQKLFNTYTIIYLIIILIFNKNILKGNKKIHKP